MDKRNSRIYVEPANKQLKSEEKKVTSYSKRYVGIKCENVSMKFFFFNVFSSFGIVYFHYLWVGLFSKLVFTVNEQIGRL